MKFTTAGESHGKALLGIIEGMPAGLKLNLREINRKLALRQSGYGRGERQKLEKDEIELLSGVRNLVTTGSPVAFAVINRDYQNWREFTAPEGCDAYGAAQTVMRPGHADLAGTLKFGFGDARNVSERASARETAARVAAGGIFMQYLAELGVHISGYVRSVCGITDDGEYSFGQLEYAKTQPLFMLNEEKQRIAMELIDELKEDGDTAGGIIEVRVNGLKSGFGSCMEYDKKLDALLCGAVMGVQAIKGVEIGMGFAAAGLRGSCVHDKIYYDEKFRRATNNAGGIEGGMSNGEEIVIRAAMKPLPTLMRGLGTVDFSTKKPTSAAGERSDAVAVCAAETVLESVVACTVSQVVAERLGGDYMREVKKRYNALP